MAAKDALDVLHNRVSCGILTEPAPSGAVLENIMRAALRAADHRVHRPWRFLIVAADGRQRLGDIFVEAVAAAGEALDESAREKLRAKPLRAPMIIVAIAACVDDPKVPAIEQILSAGCAVQNMLNAAYAQDVGAMWRTGPMAYDARVKAALGLSANEHIVGFLYLGSVRTALKPVPELDPAVFFSTWP